MKTIVSEAVPLLVRFKLTDLESRPIAGARVRVVVGVAKGWQGADSGHRFTTNSQKDYQFETLAPLLRCSRKRPSDFFTGLAARPEPTRWLQVAAELEYAGQPRLYVVQLHRFERDGLVTSVGVTVFNAMAGEFTLEAKATNDGWVLPDLGNLVLNGPGHVVSRTVLQTDPSDVTCKRWLLDIAFRRAPEPMRR
jgi:hypothetical protein